MTLRVFLWAALAGILSAFLFGMLGWQPFLAQFLFPLACLPLYFVGLRFAPAISLLAAVIAGLVLALFPWGVEGSGIRFATVFMVFHGIPAILGVFLYTFRAPHGWLRLEFLAAILVAYAIAILSTITLILNSQEGLTLFEALNLFYEQAFGRYTPLPPEGSPLTAQQLRGFLVTLVPFVGGAVFFFTHIGGLLLGHKMAMETSPDTPRPFPDLKTFAMGRWNLVLFLVPFGYLSYLSATRPEGVNALYLLSVTLMLTLPMFLQGVSVVIHTVERVFKKAGHRMAAGAVLVVLFVLLAGLVVLGLTLLGLLDQIMDTRALGRESR